jgi:SAM-dependent methyltransferase
MKAQSNILDMPLAATHTSYKETVNSFYRTQAGRLALMEAIIQAGGPKANEYQTVDSFIETISKGVQNNYISAEEVEEIKDLFASDLLHNTIHGYGLRKPMGYAGDFKIIDMIYTHHMTQQSEYKNWDRYFHYHPATSAVRNRKEFFKNEMLAKLSDRTKALHLLNVASGPARDLLEVYQHIEPEQLITTCVDLDDRAIDYARQLCRNYLTQIQFIHKNIMRFTTTDHYDVIWSAGLFDYFDDKTFVLVLKRFLSWLKPGGEIILGNFSESNPSRAYMEIFGEWFLIHRSSEQLAELALQAGALRTNITVDYEPLGINLFLKIRK